jgi:TorA maturation chaperone TorD
MDPMLAEAIAQDLDSLAALHDREIDAATLGTLRAFGFPDNLGLLPDRAMARQAWELMRATLTDLPEAPDQVLIDELAADYASIYLNGTLGASPYESVWVSDDHLKYQDAMFELRALYAGRGLGAADWRQRADDHFLLQLQFIAHLLRKANSAQDLRELAGIMDEHLLRWFGEFAARVAARCDTAFYAALAMLTAAYCEQMRNVLANLLCERRPTPQEVEDRCRSKRQPVPAPIAFLPGSGPGW